MSFRRYLTKCHVIGFPIKTCTVELRVRVVVSWQTYWFPFFCLSTTAWKSRGVKKMRQPSGAETKQAVGSATSHWQPLTQIKAMKRGKTRKIENVVPLWIFDDVALWMTTSLAAARVDDIRPAADKKVPARFLIFSFFNGSRCQIRAPCSTGGSWLKHSAEILVPTKLQISWYLRT